MTQFDQRGQHVTGQQYNAGRDINFGAVQSSSDLTAQLEQLQQAISQATTRGLLPEDTGIDAEANLKKAVAQSKKPAPDKKKLLDYLNATKTLIENLAAAGGLVTVVVEAIQAVQKLFP